MRDIPFFQTENGVASLILREVAYKKIAYIRVQSSLQLDAFLRECVDFCSAVGAEKVYATGDHNLKSYPIFTSVVKMECFRDKIPESKGKLIPVDIDSLDHWRNIYNERMRSVPNAATLTMHDIDTLLNGSAWFVYDSNALLGIGKVCGNVIEAIASIVPGSGREVLASLCDLIMSDTVCVEVATANEPAMKLYKDMGFEISGTVSDWFCIK